MRWILVSFIFVSYLFSYITATKVNLNDKMTVLYYTHDAKWSFFDKTFYVKNKPLFFSTKKVEKYNYVIKEKDDFGEIKEKTIPLDKVPYKYLLGFLMQENIPANFVVEKNGKNYLVEVTSDTEDIDNKIFGEITADKIRIKFKRDLEDKKNVNSEVDLYFYGDVLVRLSVDDTDYDLIRIVDSNVEKYISYLRTLPTILKGFDFSNEPIWATYKADLGDSVKFVKVTYSMIGKRKDIIKIDIKGNSSVIGPNYSSDLDIENKAYLREQGNILFEGLKILKVNGETTIKWKQDPRSGFLVVNYLNDNGQIDSTKIERGNKWFLDYAGVWYLISFLDKRDIYSKKFQYLREVFPLDADVEKSGNSYNFKTRLDDLTFILDEYHRIIKIIDNKHNIILSITKDGFLNKQILKNKQFLKDFVAKHNLKEIR